MQLGRVFSGIEREVTPGGQLVHAFVDTMRGRNIVVVEVEGKGIAIDFAIKVWMLPDGLQLGTKNKVSAGTSIIKRFNSQPITNQIELAFLAVP